MFLIWPYIAKSPVATQWEWSPLTQDAYKTIRHLFQPTTSGLFAGCLGSGEKDTTAPIPGLPVIHVRWGDFKYH
jgi:hypothetical protein